MGPMDVPDDEPAGAEEQAAAAALAARLDASASLLTADAAGPEVDELAELALVIRAGVGSGGALAAPTQRRIVEAALGHAMRLEAGAPVASLSAARARRRGPVVVAIGAALAAAAGVVLAVRLGGSPAPRPTVAVAPVPVPVPATWRARPTDALVGEIAPGAADRADARIDLIFGDRMAAFRERTLAVGGAR